MLQRFEMTGHDVERFILKKKSAGKPITVIGSPEIENYLLSTECLTSWAHLTILQRCQKIQDLYGVTVKRHKLQLFYY